MPRSRPSRTREAASFAARHAAGAAAVAAAAGLGLAVKQLYGTDVPAALLLLLAVVLTGARLGLGPSLLACVCAAGVLDFFFLDPVYDFAIARSADVAALVVFGLVAAAAGEVSARVRARAAAAARQAAFVGNLYSLSRTLAGALTVPDATAAALAEIAAALQAEARFDPSAGDERRPLRGEARATLPAADGGGAIRVVRAGPPFTATELELATAMAGLLDLALSRLRLGERMEEARLAAARHALTETLLDAVAHDLRGPLASIAAASGSLRAQAAGLGEEAQDSLRIIDVQADRLRRLVANLVGMIRLEGGAAPLSVQPVDLVDAVGAAADRGAHLLGGRALRVRVPADLPFALMDPATFEQVMLNLLDNAAKFSPTDSTVEVVARSQGEGAVAVEVRDRGPGVAPDQLEKMFEKFVAGAAPEGGKGLGLGLAICRGLLAATGGAIAAANRPGGGLTVAVTLPAVHIPHAAASAELQTSA